MLNQDIVLIVPILISPTGPGNDPNSFSSNFLSRPESGDFIGFSIKNAFPSAFLGVSGIELIPSKQ